MAIKVIWPVIQNGQQQESVDLTEFRKQAYSELYKMSMLRHENIVKLLGMVDSGKCSGTDLNLALISDSSYSCHHFGAFAFVLRNSVVRMRVHEGWQFVRISEKETGFERRKLPTIRNTKAVSHQY